MARTRSTTTVLISDIPNLIKLGMMARQLGNQIAVTTTAAKRVAPVTAGTRKRRGKTLYSAPVNRGRGRTRNAGATAAPVH
jgi:hypothetical protein